MKALRALPLLLLAALPLRAAELSPEKGVPALRLEQPSVTSVAPVPAFPALPTLSVPLPAQAAAVPSAPVLAPDLGAVSVAPPPAPAVAPASLSAPPVRGPPPVGLPPLVRFVAGRDHQAAAGSFSAVRERVLAEVGRNWSALPLQELFSSADALVLGESHRSLSSYDLLARELPRLKAAGVAAVGLEGLKAPHQPAVDRWLADPAAPLPAEAVSFSPSRQGSVEELFAQAKRHGVRLVALGSPLADWAAQVVELGSRGSRDPDESVPSELGEQLARAERTYRPGYNEALSEVILRRRNAAMAERLAAATPAGAKAVALVGDAHVEHPDALTYRLFWLPLEAYGSLAAELRDRSLRAVSVTLTGGLFVSPAQDRAQHRGLHAAAYRLLDEVNPAGGPAFYRTSDTTALYHLGGR